jgi:coenzyme F420-reducing hydrogenase delta subunit
MSLFKKLNFKTIVILLSVIIVISLSFFYLLNKHFQHEWVFVGGFDIGDIYYNSKSINIDTRDQIVKVWIKNVFTDKGRQKNLLGGGKNIDKDINYQLTFMFIDYKKIKVKLIKNIYYSITNNKLNSEIINIDWVDFSNNSFFGYVFNKIDEDYNLIR